MKMECRVGGMSGSVVKDSSVVRGRSVVNGSLLVKRSSLVKGRMGWA